MIDLGAIGTGPAVDADIEDELSYGCRELSLGFSALDSLREAPPEATLERPRGAAATSEGHAGPAREGSTLEPPGRTARSPLR